MTRDTQVTTSGFVWIPPSREFPTFKVVLTSNETDYTVADSTETDPTQPSNKVLNCNLTMESRKLGLFNLELVNNQGEYLNKFDAGDSIKIYADYNDGSTEIFRGKIEEVLYSLSESEGYTINITGKDYPEASGLKIIESFFSPDTVWTGLNRLTENYITDVTVTYWNESSWTTHPSVTFTPLEKSYEGESVEEAIEDICSIGGLEAYFEYSNGWKLRVFNSSDKISSENAVSIGVNLMSLSDFGKDYDNYRNKIRVTGNIESDNIVLLKSETVTPESGMWVKEEWVNDSSLNTMALVQAQSNNLLTEKSTLTYTGRITTVGLDTLKPGFEIPISVPYCGISGNYKVTRFTHDFTDSLITNLEINRRVKTLKDFIGDLKAVQRGLSPSVNVNNMENSYVVFFDENPSVCVHNNTEETEGKLKLSGNNTSGTMTTQTYTTDENFTQVEMRVYSNFPDTQNDTYEISNDGGTTWKTVKLGVLTNLPTAGNRLRVRINLSGAYGLKPTYESVCVLYK
ncbi:hypothetical protein DRN69_00570 [Candidatus Pacearchaeota archaeon]|nr:MAG: hypothetical protein DRN69_00570 [Candidatus Pacearchaeota archaeon]